MHWTKPLSMTDSKPTTNNIKPFACVRFTYTDEWFYKNELAAIPTNVTTCIRLNQLNIRTSKWNTERKRQYLLLQHQKPRYSW